jgi:hypothetical protein
VLEGRRAAQGKFPGRSRAHLYFGRRRFKVGVLLSTDRCDKQRVFRAKLYSSECRLGRFGSLVPLCPEETLSPNPTNGYYRRTGELIERQTRPRTRKRAAAQNGSPIGVADVS